MAETLKLTRLIGDHMVLSHRKPARLWGWDAPGRKVRVSFFSEDGAELAKAETVTAGDGTFLMELGPLPVVRQGGKLIFTDDAGESVTCEDVLVGEVWYASGQSNMDIPMERVRDRYPVEIKNCAGTPVRTCRLTEYTVYDEPLKEPLTGTWECPDPESLLHFSALGWFFSETRREQTGMPVGFIHASLGGSLIQSWMSREMLSESTEAAPEGYPELLREADRYADTAYVTARVSQNMTQAEAWNAALEKAERENEKDGYPGLPAGTLSVPGYFRETESLSGFIGSLRITRHFTLTEDMVAEAAKGRVRLFLGTLVDRDEAWINGQKVGETLYQYPPRKYEVPASALRAGDNEITLRLVVETGEGRFTPKKKYSLLCVNNNDMPCEISLEHPESEKHAVVGNGLAWEVDLSGEWKYQALATAEAVPPTDFINWHPTGLFNGMAAPCSAYAFDGMLWYQGESNPHLPEDYLDLQCRMARGYRNLLRDESLPFLYVQLPNFVADLTEDRQWPDIRERQRLFMQTPEGVHSGMVCTMDLGEDYDLHPHEKREVGRRLALLASEILDGTDAEAHGPEAARAVFKPDGRIVLTLDHAAGLQIRDIGKGSELRDFVGYDETGKRIPLQAQIDAAETSAVLSGEGDLSGIREIRWLDVNTPDGGLIYNEAGLPMGPFRISVEV